MKIMVVSNLYPPNVKGGAEIAAHNLAVGLVNSGEQVFAVTLGDKDSVYYHDGIKVYTIKCRNLYSPFLAKQKKAVQKLIWHAIDMYNPLYEEQLKRILKSEKPNLVHCHNIDGFSIIIWKLASLFSLPLIQHLHDYHFICIHSDLLKRNGKDCKAPNFMCKARALINLSLMSRMVSHIISPSKFCYSKYLNLIKSNMASIPFSIITNGSPLAESERTKVKWHSENFDILFIGKLISSKGIRPFIQAAQRLLATHPRMRFHVAGTGELASFVQEASLADPRIIYHGFVSGEQKLQLLQGVHVVMVPSIWQENNPVTIIEAFSLGIPVLVSRAGGMPEIVPDEFLFSPGNIEEMEKKIVLYFLNRDLLKDFSLKLLEDRNKYGIKKQVTATKQIYEKLLAK